MQMMGQTVGPKFLDSFKNMKAASRQQLWLQLQWSHLHFICFPTDLINFIPRLIPDKGKDARNKLVCSQHMGLHSSLGRQMQR